MIGDVCRIDGCYRIINTPATVCKSCSDAKYEGRKYPVAPFIKRTPVEYFWFKTNKTNGCWLWSGSVSSYGYGKMKIDGKQFSAHRFSWEIHIGVIDDGLCVCHTCDTPLCVNPAHLFLGTNQENSYDRHEKGRTKGAFPSGDKHPMSKLSTENVISIKKRLEDGEAHKDIAKDFGVQREAITKIKNNKTWSHVS